MAYLMTKVNFMKNEIVYFDTETTGLDGDAEIIQVGLINQDGDVLLDTLVKCQGDIPKNASDIHGITKEDLADAPTWPEIHDQVFEILSTATQVKIYNASYDLRLLRQTRKRYDLEAPNVYAHCVMKAYGNLHFDGTWIKLTDACDYENIDINELQAHNAVSDCQMTRLIDIEIVKEDNRRKKRSDYREKLKQQKLALVPSDISSYPYYGQAYRPDGFKTLSQLTKRDLSKFEFAGTCCSSFGDRGYLFKPKEQ